MRPYRNRPKLSEYSSYQAFALGLRSFDTRQVVCAILGLRDTRPAFADDLTITDVKSDCFECILCVEITYGKTCNSVKDCYSFITTRHVGAHTCFENLHTMLF